MRNRRPLGVHLVASDEPTAALVAALERLGPLIETAPADAHVILVGIDEAATHAGIDTWAPVGAPSRLTVVAPPVAPTGAAVDRLRDRCGDRLVAALPHLYAPDLGRLLNAADEIGTERIAVTVALPPETSADHVAAACRFAAMALALTVAAPGRVRSTRATGDGAVVELTGGVVATVAGRTAATPLVEVQVAGSAGTARLELAPTVRFERDGEVTGTETTDPLAGAGYLGLARAIVGAATGRPGHPVRAGANLAREVLDAAGSASPPGP